MPPEKRLAPGHGACPGCGIPVNVNLLLRGIEGPVVLLFQTGCGMVVTTPYPKTAFKVPYVHNLFQNGAARCRAWWKCIINDKSAASFPRERSPLLWLAATEAWILAWVLHWERRCGVAI